MDPPQSGRQRRALGVGDDPLHLAELDLALQIAVGSEQHRYGTEPADRDRQRERAWTRPHQHTDVLALADPDRDQPADDVVDPFVDRLGRVGAVLEQEERLLGGLAPPLLDQQAQRDACAGLDLLQSRKPRQLAGGLARELPEAADRVARRSDRGARDPFSHRGGELDPVADPVADRELRRRRTHRGDGLRRAPPPPPASEPIPPLPAT